MRVVMSAILAICCLLSGCKTTKRPPLELVILPDISASIDPESRREMFAGIEEVAIHLHRGDILTIVPITGNAEADLSGRILHYELPSEESREAYDSDLRMLKVSMQRDLDRLEATVSVHPGDCTDILGSLRVGLDQFSAKPNEKRLIVLSDFIQEGRQLDFRRLGPPVGTQSIKTLLPELWDETSYRSVQISLGRLRSLEFSSLPINQQLAIEKFWHQLIPVAQSSPDGLQMLKRATATP